MMCVATDAFMSLTCIKLIQILHCLHNLQFDVGDDPHAVTYELKSG